MPNIIATMAVDDADPPGVTLEVRADGQVLTPPTPIPPDATLGLAQAVGQATGDPTVEPTLQAILTPVVQALQRAVEDGAAAQRAREQALAAWQAAFPQA